MFLLRPSRKRWEGLVHISELRREGRVANVADVVSKGQRVKVKVLSFTGSKTSLSMKVRRAKRKLSSFHWGNIVFSTAPGFLFFNRTWTRRLEKTWTPTGGKTLAQTAARTSPWGTLTGQAIWTLATPPRWSRTTRWSARGSPRSPMQRSGRLNRCVFHITETRTGQFRTQTSTT